ncbi:MAG TPA: carbohydrate ABC transporter permease [Ruminiclostridium sp.]|nr:carbohydrate ABC transporter permease [Ruminiclostridium sp.]
MKAESIKHKQIILSVLSVAIAVVLLFPLYWMLVTSFKYEADIFKTHPSLFPERIFVDSYISQLSDGQFNMFRSFFNSAVISLSVMAVSTVLSIPAAYGLARFKFLGKRIFILIFLVTQMLPAVFVLTPLFIIFKNIGVLDNYFSPIIADCTIGIPFSVLILRTYFLTIPKELDDSAKIDGCNHFSSFVRIMVPIAYPGVIVAAIFSFLFAWGDLVYGMTFISQQTMRPITAGIFNFMGQYGIAWNYLMAFGVVTILPVVLIFIFMQKYIISGLTNGAVKG